MNKHVLKHIYLYGPVPGMSICRRDETRIFLGIVMTSRRTRPRDVPPVFDLAAYPMFYIAHILQRHADNMAAGLRRHGLDNSAWRVLASLQYQDGLTIKQLARYAVLERSYISRLVAKLEQRGFVHSRVSAHDRRASAVTLTKAGRAAFQNVLLPSVQEQMDVAFAGLAPRETDAFLKTLAHVMRNVYRGHEPPFAESRFTAQPGAVLPFRKTSAKE
jgi:DNA-binding MarR family transcriptional regulator